MVEGRSCGPAAGNAAAGGGWQAHHTTPHYGAPGSGVRNPAGSKDAAASDMALARRAPESGPIHDLMRSIHALQEKAGSRELSRTTASMPNLTCDTTPAKHREGVANVLFDRERVQVEADCPGPWLRTWVEFQVDARVNKAFRELAKGECVGVLPWQKQGADALQTATRLEHEVSTLAEAHGKLCTAFQGITTELSRVREASAVVAADVKAMAVEPAKLEDLQALKGETSRHEETLADLRRAQWEASAQQRRCLSELESLRSAMLETQEEVSGLALLAERLEQCLSQCHDQVAAAAQEAANRAPPAPTWPPLEELHLSISNVDGLAERLDRQAAAQAEIEARVEELRIELPVAVVTRDDFNRHVKELRADLDEVHEGLTAQLQEDCSRGLCELKARLEMAAGENVELRQEFEALRKWQDEEVVAKEKARGERAKSTHLAEDFAQRIEEVDSAVKKQLEAWKAQLDQDITTQQKRTASELRLELRSALRSEAAAVAALDEQLWLTDQRLGQRIDELWLLQAGKPASDRTLRAELRQEASSPRAAARIEAAVESELMQTSAEEPVESSQRLQSERKQGVQAWTADSSAVEPDHAKQAESGPLPPRTVIVQSAVNTGVASQLHAERCGERSLRPSRVRFAETPEVQQVSANSTPEDPKFELSQDLIAERRARRGQQSGGDTGAAIIANSNSAKLHAEIRFGSGQQVVDEVGHGVAGSSCRPSCSAERAAAIAAARARLRVPNLRPRSYQPKAGEEEADSPESLASPDAVRAASLGG